MRIKVIVKNQGNEVISFSEHLDILHATNSYNKLRQAYLEEGEGFEISMVIVLISESN